MAEKPSLPNFVLVSLFALNAQDSKILQATKYQNVKVVSWEIKPPVLKKYLFVLIVLSACSVETEKVVLSPTEFQTKLDKTSEAILLDVRRPDEISVDRIENSQSIVFDDSFANKLEDLEHKTIFVYCASGKRSAKAAKILRDKGYKNVFELEGGLGAWKQAGLPLDNTQR